MLAQHPFKKNLFVTIQLALFFLFPCGESQGEAQRDIAWKTVESKYTLINYQSLEDLRKFNDRVNYGQEKWSLGRVFSRREEYNLSDRLIKKVDLLYERVQTILDMRKKIKKVTINVYHNERQLHDAYIRIYKASRRIRAWYIYEYHTVYINVDDLDEGLLAHEIAHSIIDYYLLVRPPKATAEILARYVDSHLLE